MSRLQTTQIAARLRQTFETLLTASGSLTDDMLLSRALAAYAIQMATDCSVEEAAKSVWDGTDDNGIDAAHYDANESRVVLVQAKWIHSGSGEPAARDIAAFVKGAYDLIEVNAQNFHSRLSTRFADITQRLQEPGTTIHLFVVSTGASDLSAPAASHLDRFLTEVNGSSHVPMASYTVLGLRQVYSAVASPGNRGDVSLDCQLFHWHYVREPYPAYFGMVDGITLKKWWQSYGKRLLSSNIRHSLGSTEVNTQIRQSAHETPEKFWYFNNGITVLAEEAAQAPASGSTREAGVFSLRGASIVNGAQTVSTLGSVEDEVALGQVRVSVRVILLKEAPDKFGEDVTKTNNLQNKIESRDFVAQDPQQHRLREEMSIEDVDYQYLRSDEFSASPNSCDLLEVTSALACATGTPQMAVLVKTGLGRFFVDLTKPPYVTIFNPGTTGSRAFNATLALRSIDEWIESEKRKLPKKSGQRHGALVHGNRLLACLAFAARISSHLDVSIVSFRSTGSHEGPAFDELMECTLALVELVLSIHYEGRHLAILFKNPSETAAVFEECIKALKSQEFLYDVGDKAPPTIEVSSESAVKRAKKKSARGAKIVARGAPLI